MRRPPLLIMTFALILSASAFANASEGEDAAAPSQRFGVVACGAGGSGFALDRVSCTARRRVLTVSDFEFSLGLEGLVSFEPGRPGRLSPVVGVDYYARTWGAFVEVIMRSFITPREAFQWRIGFTAAF